MPGYGFSDKPTTTGWDPQHIARAWVVLMKRLGYKKFVAQGGDWGAVITEQMGVQASTELLGIHTNMPGAVPPDVDKAAASGAPAPSGLSPEEKLAFERLTFVYSKGVAYGLQMGLRPQTLYGIADSPVGLAAYFLDHDAWSYALISRVFAENPPTSHEMNSRSSFQKICARASDHCAGWSLVAARTTGAPPSLAARDNN
jgi:pimeloyl-ACP methyl ester carboxylesterase